MVKNASVIEINGNRYDAVSGQLLGAVKRVASQISTPAGGVVDGLVRRPALSIISSAKTAPSAVKSKTAAAANYQRSKTTAPAVRQRAQKAQTLMRSAVKRPAASNNKVSHINSVHKPGTGSVDAVRASHAKTVSKNAKVERFGSLKPRATSPKATTTLAPTKAVANRVAASGQVISKPMPSLLASASHQQLERLLDQALLQADAHKQALRAQSKRWGRLAFGPKWLSVGAASLAVLLIAGFFAWQNVPQVSMRVAAVRSGVSAAVPAYTPSGYSFATPISSAPNKVTIQYKQANTANTFAITQQDSSWDSTTVAATAVPASSQVQTSDVNGTTVYIYGNSNDAKWVNHGVLFTLKDKANLNSDQILQIANSL